MHVRARAHDVTSCACAAAGAQNVVMVHTYMLHSLTALDAIALQRLMLSLALVLHCSIQRFSAAIDIHVPALQRQFVCTHGASAL